MQAFKLSALSLALLAVANPILAEQSQTPEIKTERITVTANRKENLDTDLPMSVESVGSEELALDNGQHAAESLNSVSGVLINQLQSGQGHNAAIRMPINYGGYYLYLQDNVPLQSPAFFNHNALWWSSFNSSVSRMEVLKGAGTALYGSGAVAATVNILSAPIDKKSTSSIELDTGEEGYGKIGFTHSQAINSQHAIRVSGSVLSNDGWRDHTASKRGEVTLRHEYTIDENQQLVSSFIVSDLEQEMASHSSEEAFLAQSRDSGLSDAVLASDPTRESKYMRLSTQWTNHIDNSRYLSVIPFYRYRSNNYTATWSSNMPTVESSVNTVGLLALAGFDHSDGSETTVGLDVEVSSGKQLSYQPVTITTTGWGADTFYEGEVYYDDTTRYTGISPYLQHNRQLTDNLTLSAGLRFDYANYDFDNHLGVTGDIGHGLQSLADREDSFNHLSPKAALNYNLTDDSSVYIRYANSFRIPTAGSLYHLKNGDSSLTAGNVDPELSDTYEIGYKLNLDNASFDIALYSMDVTDAIVTAYDDAGVRYQANAGEIAHQGIEFTANWQVDPAFDLTLAYTKAKHEFDEFVLDSGRVDHNGNSRAQEYSGNEMRLALDYIANLRLRYRPSAIEGLSSMLELQSIGDYWMDDANTRKYKGYTIANLKFHYQVNEQWSLNARVRNLTDKYYAQQAELRYGSARFSPGASRTLYLGMNYQW